MKYNLSAICEYRKGKVDVSELTLDTYISTENMLPNKAGVTRAISMPSVEQTQEYKKGDVLVSNIRPYFKKIWQAKFNGGCSNDVLVFKAKEGICSDFLYYVLANDLFFAHSMATSKGTKMPRGDKSSIMQYEVPDFDEINQRKIASILRSMDNKIELNNAINNNLMEQVTAKFQNMFGKYDNDMSVYRTLGTIAKFKYGTMPKKEKLGTGTHLAFSGYQVVGLYPEVMYSEPQLIIVARGVGGCGDIKYTPANCYLTNLAIAIITTCVEHDDYLYHYLRLHDTKVMNSGSAQPQITVSTLEKYEIPVPTDDGLSAFSDFVKPFKELYRTNVAANKQLTALRDSLLPKLMSGELDISDINL